MTAEHAPAEESRSLSPAVSVAEREDDVDALWDTCIDHILTAAGYVDRLADHYDARGSAVCTDIRRLADQLHLVARTAYGVAAHA